LYFAQPSSVSSSSPKDDGRSGGGGDKNGTERPEERQRIDPLGVPRGEVQCHRRPHREAGHRGRGDAGGVEDGYRILGHLDELDRAALPGR